MSKKTIQANVECSSLALERALKKLCKPGITLRAKKNVPQYSVAEGATDIFVRRLNGRIDYGRLVDGFFKVIN